MKTRIGNPASILMLAALVLSSCGEKKTPSRDHIPIIKERLTKLQEGVKNQNTAAIDSLLSVDILKKNQSSDSLLSFVFGPNRDFAFESFGQPVIIYTDEVAQVECFVMDSTHQTNRPVVLKFVYVSDQWLLNGFETNTNPAVRF